MPAACFLLFLVPGKSENEYSRNWTGQKPKLLFSRKIHGARRRDEGGPQGGQTTPRCGSPQAAPRHGVGPLAAHRPCLFSYKKPPDASTLNRQASSHEKFCSAVATEGEIGGQKVSVPAPCRDGEVPPEPSPSISSTISITVADSHDEEGVVLSQG